MSENLTILEGELGRQFAPVDRLSIDNQGGGVSPWVIADYLDISSLSADENGLYLATEEDCDCFDEVEVDVSTEIEDGDYKKITGKDPNDGNDYAVGLDEEGNLTKEKIPSAIHIVIKPRKLEYEDGDIIDYTGIHVYLMDGNNQRFTSEDYPTGEIPFEELLLPVTIAEGESGKGKSTLDGKTVEYSNHVLWQYHFPERSYTDYGEAISSDYLFTDGSILYAVSETSGVGERSKELWTTSKRQSSDWMNFRDRGTKQIKGKTYYYAHCDHSYYTSGMDNWNGTLSITDIVTSVDGIIDVIFNGVHSDGQEIPVQWMRSDGEMLEDKFAITISPEKTTENTSNTSDSGSGHTSGGF